MKKALSTLLALCMIISMFTLPAFAEDLQPGAAKIDGGGDIRIEEGDDTEVTYTLTYDKSTGFTTISSGMGVLNYKHDDMTFASASATHGILQIVNEATAANDDFLYTGILMVNADNLSWTYSFTDVQRTTPVSYTQFQDKLVFAFKPLVNGTGQLPTSLAFENNPTIIVQYPVDVTVTGGSVSAKITEYDTGKNTYDSNGTDTTISSGDRIWVDSGDSQQNAITFDLTADEYYALSDILVNGTSIGAGSVLTASQNSSYTTSALSADTDIEFVFAKSTSIVSTTVKTVKSGVDVISTDGGTISFDNAALDAEDAVEITTKGNQVFTLTPKTGYQIKSVTVDGVAKSEFVNQTSAQTLIVNTNDLTQDHSIAVVFDKSSRGVTVTVEGDGTVSGPTAADTDPVTGTVDVTYGTDGVFKFTPSDNTIEVKQVIVDGASLNPFMQNGYTFSNVTDNHTLKVVFGKKIDDVIIDPGTDPLVTMEGDKGIVVLRGAWGNESSYNVLSSVKIVENGVSRAATIADVDITIIENASYGFPANHMPVSKDGTTAGKINVVTSGIIDVVVTSKIDSDETATFVFIVPGDCDRNGAVDSEDATRMLETAFGTVTDTRAYTQELIDMDKSGTADSEDSTRALEIGFNMIQYAED